MEFIKKAEHFFSQLKYSLVIEPELIKQTSKGFVSLILEPSIFFQIVSDYKIDYPFFYENKIIELKILMMNENLPQNDALIIIENYRKLYWSLPPTFFEPQMDKIRQVTKHINKQVSEQEKVFLRETKELQDYLINKRERIFCELITKISEQTTPPPPNIKVVKENRTKVKKPSTLMEHQKQLDKIFDLVEKEWRKQKEKNVTTLERIYKAAKGEYAQKINKDRSQLNNELKSTGGFDEIKAKIIKIYRENI